jgi:hypothetical protein
LAAYATTRCTLADSTLLGSATGAVTPEREKRQAAVDSIDARVRVERLS